MTSFDVEMQRRATGTVVTITVLARGRWEARRHAERKLPGFISYHVSLTKPNDELGSR